METTVIFPPCFSTAPFKLKSKFRRVDPALIEDSIQYASVQYWEKQIAATIPNPEDAFGWFLCVAMRYISKETHKLKLNRPLSDALNLSASDMDFQLTCREYLQTLENDLIPTVLEHVSGYSLKEIAESQGMTLNAIKQRHSRERKTLRKKGDRFFSDFGRSLTKFKKNQIPLSPLDQFGESYSVADKTTTGNANFLDFQIKPIDFLQNAPANFAGMEK